jgi:hypothetical protein
MQLTASPDHVGAVVSVGPGAVGTGATLGSSDGGGVGDAPDGGKRAPWCRGLHLAGLGWHGERRNGASTGHAGTGWNRGRRNWAARATPELGGTGDAGTGRHGPRQNWVAQATSERGAWGRRHWAARASWNWAARVTPEREGDAGAGRIRPGAGRPGTGGTPRRHGCSLTCAPPGPTIGTSPLRLLTRHPRDRQRSIADPRARSPWRTSRRRVRSSRADPSERRRS